jgi:hypothetical protein
MPLDPAIVQTVRAALTDSQDSEVRDDHDDEVESTAMDGADEERFYLPPPESKRSRLDPSTLAETVKKASEGTIVQGTLSEYRR